jgi:outer membrane receptor protein involved in Fe transport
MKEDIYNLDIVHDWNDYTLTFNAGYQEIEYFTQTDYDWAVPNFANPAAGGASTFTPNIPSLAGTLASTDANGVMTTPADPTVSGRSVPYTYDTSAYENEAYTLEGRIQSNWTDKPFDFLAGVFYLESENSTIYDVRSNTLAALDPFGGTAAGPNGREAPLAWYRNDSDDYQLSTYAFFGEFYADITDRTRMTLGLRYSSETKEVSDRQTLLNDPTLPYEENVSNRAFLQGSLASLIADPAVTGGAPGALVAAGALPGGTDDPRFLGFGTTGNAAVPPYRQFKDEWNEMTGKVSLDHYMDLSFTDETMAFVTLSRSYKSGGINPPSSTGAFPETFEPEFINAFELGAKNRLMDGAMQANFTYFYYDYEGLQNTKIVDRTSVNENIDAEIQGVEGDFIWTPPAIEGLTVSGAFSWLDTEITDKLVPTDDVREGDELAYAPEFQGNLRARYQWFTDSGLQMHVMPHMSYSAKQESDIIVINRDTVDSWMMFGVTAGVRKDNWSAEVYADNLFDKQAELSRDFVYDRERVTYARPRTVGLRVSYDL